MKVIVNGITVHGDAEDIKVVIQSSMGFTMIETNMLEILLCLGQHYPIKTTGAL